ncbi:hypothetical protein Sjap_001001 [Stephania japonica]|uniref:Uncharacterized protein n=1 Tax=Stephania japonica TaxID=461633 RepID=A0AAP0PUL9_9MAGN
MNPLTLVKRIQKINSKEAELGISEDASWHTKYKDSAYVFVGGVPFDLTEGDLLAVFAQYGEIVDVNLVRDKATGKSKGFAFIAYEDQRSTNLAVDNLNGASVLGRIIRVDHVSKYKKKEEEDEEEEQRKREERGVCRAFQRGECNRGAACKFSHDEQRSANTGWGAKDEVPRWKNDKYDGPSKKQKSIQDASLDDKHDSFFKGENSRVKLDNKDARTSRAEDREAWPKRSEKDPREEEWRDIKRRYGNESHVEDWGKRETKRKLEKYEPEQSTKEDQDRKRREERSARHELERNRKEDDSRREREERFGRHEPEPSSKDHERRGRVEKPDRHDSELNSKSYDSRAREEKTDRKYSQKNPHDDRDLRNDKHSRHDRDSSSHHRRGEADRQRSYK